MTTSTIAAPLTRSEARRLLLASAVAVAWAGAGGLLAAAIWRLIGRDSAEIVRLRPVGHGS